MTKELYYFNINAIAESIRYILHYTKQEFVDVRHDFSPWPNQKIKDSEQCVPSFFQSGIKENVSSLYSLGQFDNFLICVTSANFGIGLPYGQFPLYKEGGRTLHQSLAILKYVARDTELIPKDPWEQAVAENIVCTIYDYWYKVAAYIIESDLEKKYELKKKLLDETIDFYFSRFENNLKENGGYFIGKLSWAEFVLCGLVEASNLGLAIKVETKYPTVTTVIEKIRNLPGVKEHIAARGPYKLPLKTIQYKGLDILEHSKGLTK